ncbi:hypothetical protein HGRIS_011721 [Hohenbuehelia grisea]|uniref:Uncharacterized protein n=1 Tax=Hohenbuehelia grisea TaxID=104357 RepID=A0ABR3JW50_9AGAR
MSPNPQDAEPSRSPSKRTKGTQACFAAPSWSRKRNRILFAALLAPYAVLAVSFSTHRTVTLLMEHSRESQMKLCNVITHLVPFFVCFAALLASTIRHDVRELAGKNAEALVVVVLYWTGMGLLTWAEPLVVPLFELPQTECHEFTQPPFCHTFTPRHKYYAIKLVVVSFIQIILVATFTLRRRDQVFLKGQRASSDLLHEKH